MTTPLRFHLPVSLLERKQGRRASARFSRQPARHATSSARVSHFFGAIKIGAFRDPAEFRQDMDKMLRDLRLSPPAAGAERVYFAGRKEFEHEDEVRRSGVPLFQETVASLEKISRETSVLMPEPIRSVQVSGVRFQERQHGNRS
jgi:LDH2 family malate/lactate/ureidoglycolate dehydrogenase